MITSNRRQFLASGAAGAAATSLFGALPAVAGGSERFHDEFPSHDPDLVRELVGAAHGRLDRVRELVTARPALAKVAWDWGFGDWESALGAASHMGRRDIAEILLEHGARPTLFSAAMMGQLDVVRAWVEASPGVQGTLGPHGITLLTHARHGEATEVVEYLERVGGADPQPETRELSATDREKYLGAYAFDGDGGKPLEVYEHSRSGNLMIKRGDRFGRFLNAIGDDTFFPGGAEAVRIRFAMEDGVAATVSVWDPGLIVTGHRVEA